MSITDKVRTKPAIPDEWPESQKGDAWEPPPCTTIVPTQLPTGSLPPSPPTPVSASGGILNAVPISQLVPLGDADEWLVELILGPGRKTLFSGRGKDAGKTTFWTHVMRKMESGGNFCGLAIGKAGILWITEETATQWAARRDKYGLGDWIHPACQPFPKGRPTESDWQRLIADILAYCTKHAIRAVAFDTVARLLPIRDENNNSEVATAMAPLDQLTHADLAVLLIHHSGWMASDRSRGASAFHDCVDFVLNYQNAGIQYPRRRVLDAKGRSERMPYELTIELSDDGNTFMRVQGGPAPSAWDVIDAILPADGHAAWTVEEMHAQLPPEFKVVPKTLANGIAKQVQIRGWTRIGDGGPGHPYRYFKQSLN